MDNDPLTAAPAVVRQVAAQLRDVYADIGRQLAAAGGELRCRECGGGIPLGSAADVAGYMHDGWPRCCGRERTWITASQLAQETTV